MTKIKKYVCLAILVSCIYSHGSSQQKYIYFNSTTAEQLGYALTIQAEIGSGNGDLFNWRIGLAAGAGAFLIKDILYPSLQTNFMLYHGGLGSSWPGEKSSRNYFDVELNIGYTLTAGFHNRMEYSSNLNPGKRNYPLFYFKNFTTPLLQNPYNYSLSWGGNAVFFFTGRKERFQQVGFVNLHVDRMQFSYSNDGPPFKPPFGDKFDRLHTGGGFITFHGNTNWDIDVLEIGFNKFTGYSKNTYELGNKVGTAYMYYSDEKQQFYNKSHIFLGAGNTSQGWTTALNFYNYTELDVQHMIHQSLFYPLHMVPYKGHISAAAAYYTNYLKTGLK